MASRFVQKFSGIWKKIEDWVAVAIVAFMAIFPLIVKIIESTRGASIINNENIMLNIVFMFSCVAGAITWREDKHISLASLSEVIARKVGKPIIDTIVQKIRNVAVVAILTSIFLSAFSEFFMFFSQTIWGIPTKVFYTLLPLSYFVMLFRSCSKKDKWISSLIGVVIGLYIASGPLSGILYSLFNGANLDWLYSISNSWLWFSDKAFVFVLILLIILAIMGVPLFISLAGIAYLCFSQGGGYVEVIPQETYSVLTDSSIAAIPLFTIVGYLLSQGSAGRRLVDVFNAAFGWFKGGTIIAAVLVVTFFTMFTGASGVTILALGALLSMLMTGTGYDKDRAESLITASGALGLLFPPSVAIIMYGTVNYFSVDVFEIFKGAIIPGLILAIATIAWGIFKDKNNNRPKFNGKFLGKSLLAGLWEFLLPVSIMVLYFGGFLTIMQTSAFALVYTYILETFIRKDFVADDKRVLDMSKYQGMSFKELKPYIGEILKLNGKDCWESFKGSFKIVAGSIPITGGILMIVGSARGLSYFLIDANVPFLISEFCQTYIHSKYLFLLLLNIVLIIVGCLMDIYSAIMIVSPLIIPIAASFGLSQVHIAVVFLMNMQLGFLTPPVGMDLFISTYAFDKPLMKVVKGILPFLAIQAIVLLLITYIPWFTTVLL